MIINIAKFLFRSCVLIITMGWAAALAYFFMSIGNATFLDFLYGLFGFHPLMEVMAVFSLFRFRFVLILR